MAHLVDTHCHLYFNLYKSDLPEVIHRAEDAGVERILIPGIDLETNRLAVQLCEDYPLLYAAVGIHPNDANGWSSNTINELSQLALHPKVIAIGEIGLDFHHRIVPPDAQKEALLSQLELARHLQKPVIIHSRHALPETSAILCEWQKSLPTGQLSAYPGVFHSFEGNLADAQFITKHNFLIGIAGPVTFKNAVEKHTLAKGLPLSQILLETDAPFLTPHPHRGTRNEPAHVLLVAQCIAQLRQVSLEDISSTTCFNANQLLRWSSHR